MTKITDDSNTQVFTDHNVYILGAGFSVDAGIPVLNDFLFQMRASLNWLREQRRDLEFDAVRRVLTFRKEAASAGLRVNLDLENIEDLFSLASATAQGTLEESVSTAIAATIEFSRRTAPVKCFEAIVADSLKRLGKWTCESSNNGSRRCVIPYYDLYAGFLSGKAGPPGKFMKNTVITFNYDTVLEDALRNWSVKPWYGFRPDSASYDASRRCAQNVESDVLPIFKLHGSVNWAEDSHRKLAVYDNYADILKANKRVVLIPPTWRKTFQDPLNDVWNAAVQALSEATRIIIIGFSIPPSDLHFKFLLAAGLQENISLRKIVCVDPSDQVEKNLSHILRQELINPRTTDFNRVYARDIFSLSGPHSRLLCSELNRAIVPNITDITNGPEASSLGSEWVP